VNPPRVLLLLPTHTYKAHDFLQAAERLGVEAVVGSERPQALEGITPGRTVALTLSDAEKAAREIARFAEGRPLAAVVPTDDQTALVAARAAGLLGLPHNPPRAVLAARRKDLLRALLSEAGVRTPRHRLVPADPSPDDADLEARAREQAYPCVLKPTFLSASRGVVRADTPAQFAAAFRRIEALFRLPDVAERAGIESPGEPAAGHRASPDRSDPRGAVLVEEFVPGLEVALEGLLSAGRLKVLAVFDKPDPLDGPYFEETIYVTPSRLREAEQQAIRETSEQAASALGLVEGPVHAELRLDGRGAWLIEIAARSIGGLCGRVLRFGAGVALEDLILLHALGRGIGEYERERQPAGVMMLPVPRAGILREVRGVAAARAVPGIADVTISATLGKPLVPWPEGSSYPGFVFARADTPAAVEAALREAHRRLEFVVA
jgi:biotin carboxylase